MADVLVLDTSALLDAIAANEPAAGLTERIVEEGDLHAFVALAEMLGAPLVTCDACLAGASSHEAHTVFEVARR